MRYICIYKSGKPERNTPPSQDEMAAMGALIDDMTKAGVLVALEGCKPSSEGVRLRVGGNGKVSVTDGPFTESKEIIGGACIIRVSSKDEAIAWGKRFLAVVGEGESEIRLLHDA